ADLVVEFHVKDHIKELLLLTVVHLEGGVAVGIKGVPHRPNVDRHFLVEFSGHGSPRLKGSSNCSRVLGRRRVRRVAWQCVVSPDSSHKISKKLRPGSATRLRFARLENIPLLGSEAGQLQRCSGCRGVGVTTIGRSGSMDGPSATTSAQVLWLN